MKEIRGLYLFRFFMMVQAAFICLLHEFFPAPSTLFWGQERYHMLEMWSLIILLDSRAEYSVQVTFSSPREHNAKAVEYYTISILRITYTLYVDKYIGL